MPSAGSERTDSRSGSECSGDPEGATTTSVSLALLKICILCSANSERLLTTSCFQANLGWRTFDSSLGVAGAALATPPPAVEIAATGGAWARAPVSCFSDKFQDILSFGPFEGHDLIIICTGGCRNQIWPLPRQVGARTAEGRTRLGGESWTWFRF